MRLCPSNGITGIRLCEGSAGGGWRKGRFGGRSEQWVSPDTAAGQSAAVRRQKAAAPRGAAASLPPGPAAGAGRASRPAAPGRGCQQTPKRGVVSSIDLCK